MTTLKDTLNNWQNTPLNKSRKKPLKRKLPDEESFFNAFVDHFILLPYASVIARKTHGYKVDYVPSKLYQQIWNCQTVRKEISDVFIVAFSLQKHMIRMTHLQAKYLRTPSKNVWNSPFTFNLDTGQFYMLSNRLDIIDKGIYPPDILSNSLYSDSITTYGVFYPDSNGDIDMAFEVASLIEPLDLEPYPLETCNKEHVFATATDLYGYLNHKGTLPCDACYYPQKCQCVIPPHSACYYCCHELLSTLSVDVFEHRLYDMHVGTRVDIDPKMMNILVTIFSGAKEDVRARLSQCVAEINEIIKNNDKDRSVHDNQLPIFDEDGGGVYLLIDADWAKEFEPKI